MASKKKDKNTLSNPAINSKEASGAYESWLDTKPGEFSYSVKKPVWDKSDGYKYYTDLLNRKDFSFDVNQNALYNQYKDIHQKQGNLAMMDTMGQAAALSGGYGNSYAASAGAQAYQQNLDKLTEKVPELYQLAMQQYQLEGQNLADKFNAAYGIYRDSVDDWYKGYDVAYGQHRDSVADWQFGADHLYGVYSDAIRNEQAVAAHNASIDQFNREFEYGKERDKILDDQWAKEFGLSKDEFEHAVAMDEEKLKQWAKEFGLSKDEFEHAVAMDKEKLKQWAKEFGLSEKELEEAIRMNDWKIAEAGRLG